MLNGQQDPHSHFWLGEMMLDDVKCPPCWWNSHFWFALFLKKHINHTIVGPKTSKDQHFCHGIPHFLGGWLCQLCQLTAPPGQRWADWCHPWNAPLGTCHLRSEAPPRERRSGDGGWGWTPAVKQKKQHRAFHKLSFCNGGWIMLNKKVFPSQISTCLTTLKP